MAEPQTAREHELRSARRADVAPGRGTQRQAKRQQKRQEKARQRALKGRPKPVVMRQPDRRYRQTIRRVDLWSVLKVSVAFYLCGLVVVLAAGMVLWWVASAFGVIGSLEDFLGELLEADDFEFLSWRILRGATLIGLVLVCLMVVVTTLAAALYNLFAELVGGVEITVSEEESKPS